MSVADLGSPAPADPVRRAPHVRNALDVPAMMNCVLLAAAPCFAVALYNTGDQIRRAVAAGYALEPGWRQLVAELLGAGSAPSSGMGCAVHGALYVLPVLLACALGGALAERAFARLRRRPVDHVALPVIALLLSLSLPPTLAPWKAALGCAIGVIFAKELFGGYGRGFVNPVVAGLVFLYFAYPASLTGDAVWVAVDGYSGATPLALAARGGPAAIETANFTWLAVVGGSVPGAMGETSALACLLGLGFLVYTGVASLRIAMGGLIGLALGVVAMRLLGAASPAAELPWHWHLVSGGLAFGLVFLATDPVTSAATGPGRWACGILIGVLVVLIRAANPAHVEGVVLALLLGNVCAPLIDQIVARVQQGRRLRRGTPLG